jgi:hypothetical protein
MKVEIRKIVTEMVEMSLPMYVRNSAIHFYKIISEGEVIQVCQSKFGNNSITEVSVSVALHGNWEVCTEEEFETAFYKVSEYFKDKVS